MSEAPEELFPSDEEPHDREDHWISLSDLMTGLMMIFMLVAVAFMLKIEQESQQARQVTAQYKEMKEKLEAQSAKMEQVAMLYDEIRRNLYQELMRQFGSDLPKWDAELTPDLAVRFKNPDVLFATGKDELKPKFKAILDNFFPRYVKLITSGKYRADIQEVRIEGHTSSIWADAKSPEDAYFKNMALSQARTRQTLRFVLELPQVQSSVPWLRKHVTANGLSSSHPILDHNGSEDIQRSQRVEFRIRTDAEFWLQAIKDTLK